MKKLDWYILRKFVTTFIFCMLLFTVIAIAVDSSEKTDDFVKSGLSTRQIVSQYYVAFVPYIWGLLYPLFVFIAVIFFTSKMAGRSEIIAMLATGTTYNRWLRTYVAGGLLFAVVLWFAAAFYIPKANDMRGNFQSKYIDPPPRAYDNSNGGYRRVDPNTYMGLKYFDTVSKSGSTFFLDRVHGTQLIYNLRAETIRWDSVKKDWLLSSVVERKVDSMREIVTQFPTMHIDLHMTPEAFRKDQYLKDRLTTPKLREYIKVEELRGSEGVNTLKVERYRRTATCYSVFLLTLIGAIMAGRKTRGGSGLHLALGIIIAAVFIMFDRFSTVFSVKGDLHPMLAAWIPNILFTILAIYLYKKAPK